MTSLKAAEGPRTKTLRAAGSQAKSRQRHAVRQPSGALGAVQITEDFIYTQHNRTSQLWRATRNGQRYSSNRKINPPRAGISCCHLLAAGRLEVVTCMIASGPSATSKRW